MANRWGNMKIVTDFILGGSKITADGDCSHEITAVPIRCPFRRRLSAAAVACWTRAPMDTSHKISAFVVHLKQMLGVPRGPQDQLKKLSNIKRV